MRGAAPQILTDSLSLSSHPGQNARNGECIHTPGGPAALRAQATRLSLCCGLREPRRRDHTSVNSAPRSRSCAE